MAGKGVEAYRQRGRCGNQHRWGREGDTVDRAARLGAQLHLVGYAADRHADLDIFTAIQRAITVRAATGGSRASFEGLVRTLHRHSLHPVVDSVWPSDHLTEAFERLDQGGHLGKILISLDN